jgi:hypothetical protein
MPEVTGSAATLAQVAGLVRVSSPFRYLLIHVDIADDEGGRA